MAHAQKPDLVFQRKGRVHLNWRGWGWGGQFSRLLAAEVCASAVVMVVILDTPCSEVECKTTGYPLHSHVSPSLPLPCVTVCHQVPKALYNMSRLHPTGPQWLTYLGVWGHNSLMQRKRCGWQRNSGNIRIKRPKIHHKQIFSSWAKIFVEQCNNNNNNNNNNNAHTVRKVLT